MKTFFLTSLTIQLISVIALTIIFIVPTWYFGLANGQRLNLQITLLILIVGQIVAAILWRKMFKENILLAVIPILIPILYYGIIVQ